jgi:hypothetical protein
MYRGVRKKQELLFRDPLAVSWRPSLRTGGRAFGVRLVLSRQLSILVFTRRNALGAHATVCLGLAIRLFVLSGSMITNAGYYA